MPIIEINIAAVEPFAEGKAFGQAGGYVRVRGVARGVLDPQAPENAGIVDLDKATRNKAGQVEYATDFFILRPAEPRRGSGMLVYDVTNRGSKRILQLIDDVPANDPIAVNDPKTARDAGLGFLLGRGHSIVWSRWDPGAPRANNGLGADFPVALENGHPITGRIRDEFHVGTRGPAELVRFHQARPDQPEDHAESRAGNSGDHQCDGAAEDRAGPLPGRRPCPRRGPRTGRSRPRCRSSRGSPRPASR